MTTACAANRGLVAALDYLTRALGLDAGVALLGFIWATFGPATEGAVLAQFTANAFARASAFEPTPTQIGNVIS